MDDNNLPGTEPGPDVTTPPTEASLIEDISNLLDDPATDPAEEPEDSEAAPPTVPEEDDLGLSEEAEDVDDPDDETDPDGLDDPEVKGGRYAPDSAKVKLETGETITIGDLKGRVDKRVKDFQRGFTEKSQALSAKEAQVDQRAQSLDQFQEYVAWIAENHLPKQPAPFAGAPDDYVGFVNWQRENAEWQAHAQAYQQFLGHKKADTEKRAGETQKQADERLANERDALLKAIPAFKDPAKAKVMLDAIVTGATQHYGVSAEEVNAIADHRMLQILRDAIAYQRIKAKAPQVQAQVTARPAIRPGKRTAPQAANAKEQQARTERLRNSGSLEDFAAATSHLFE